VKTNKVFLNFAILLGSALFAGPVGAEIVQFGKMREALAEGKSQARVTLSELTQKPHFYGVGAMEGLSGEVAVIDGEIIATQAKSPQEFSDKADTKSTKATYFVGDYVPKWQTIKTNKAMTMKEIETFIADTAAQKGIPTQEPFMFKIEGKAETADTHVIRGACPMHARMKKIELPESQKPFEAKLKAENVVIVGVFAKDRVGDLTHPATDIHAHIIFTDSAKRKRNGHAEDFVLAKGSLVSIPQN